MMILLSRKDTKPLMVIAILLRGVAGQEKPELSVGLKAPNLLGKKFWGGPVQPSLQFTKCGVAGGCDLAVRKMWVLFAIAVSERPPCYR